MYKLVIFDFDGTLADTFPWFVRAFRVASERYGLPNVSDEQVELFRKVSAREVMRGLQLPFWKVPLIARFMRRMMTEQAGTLHPFEGVQEVLQVLQQNGVPLSIVTSNSERNVRAILGDEMMAMMGPSEFRAGLFGKSRLLRRVLRRVGVAPADAIYFGDEIRDLHAAHKVGLPFGAVAWGFTDGAAFRALQPTFVIDAVPEIVNRVLGRDDAAVV